MVIILTWIKELLTFLLFFLAISLMFSMSHLIQATGALGYASPQFLLAGYSLSPVAG